MSKLISGKDALIALANGNQVLYINPDYQHTGTWGFASELEVREFGSGKWVFKLKPRTIKLNGIEVKQLTKNCPIYENDGIVKIECDNQDDAVNLVAALRSIFNENC